jgi:hypothetical protein
MLTGEAMDDRSSYEVQKQLLAASRYRDGAASGVVMDVLRALCRLAAARGIGTGGL